MSRLINALPLLLVTVFSAGVLAQSWEWAPDFPEGTQLPPIAAQDQSGTVRTLADLSGEKGLVLVFEVMGFNVATMTYDSLETLNNAAIDYSTDFPLLRDEDTQHFSALGIVNDQYEPGERAYGIPYPGIFLLSPDGTIEAKFAEVDYRERPDFSLVLAIAETL